MTRVPFILLIGSNTGTLKQNGQKGTTQDLGIDPKHGRQTSPNSRRPCQGTPSQHPSAGPVSWCRALSWLFRFSGL